MRLSDKLRTALFSFFCRGVPIAESINSCSLVPARLRDNRNFNMYKDLFCNVIIGIYLSYVPKKELSRMGSSFKWLNKFTPMDGLVDDDLAPLSPD